MMLTQGLLEKTVNKETVNVLLVYPENPKDTYWGFDLALKYIGKKATFPPLGLITIPGLFPENYQFSLLDMNVEPLTDARMQQADIVATSSMVVHAQSLKEIVHRSLDQEKTLLLGGPYPTKYYDLITGKHTLQGFEHPAGQAVFILGEGEQTIPLFTEDLQHGILKSVYARPPTLQVEQEMRTHFAGSDMDIEFSARPPLSQVAPARYDLIKLEHYDSMILQFSRGCGGGCDFCDVRDLYGGSTRYRPKEDIVAELETLHQLGWKGGIFVGDDNTIGVPRKAQEIFEAITEFQEEKGHPYHFGTEMSLLFGDRPKLRAAYRKAGGTHVFLGLETPNVASLEGTHKFGNIHTKEQDLETAVENQIHEVSNRVHAIQADGIEVSAGFIVGFDQDTDPRVFEWQKKLIDTCGIPTAMVGILIALKGTALYRRLESEGRLLGETSGDNTHAFSTNFETAMDPKELSAGYQQFLQDLYPQDMGAFFDRCNTMLDTMGPKHAYTAHMDSAGALALLKTTKLLASRSGMNYVRFMTRTILKHPKLFGDAVRLAIYGDHFRSITQGSVMKEDFRQYVARSLAEAKDHVHELPAVVTAYFEAQPKSYRNKVQELYTGVIDALGSSRPMDALKEHAIRLESVKDI